MSEGEFRIQAVHAKSLWVAAVVFGAVALWWGASPTAALVVALAGPLVLRVLVALAAASLASTRAPVTVARYADPRDLDGLADVNAMSGTEFEDYVAQVARSWGLPVILTSSTGDWGVDLIVGNRPRRLAIQCKRRSRPVGAGAVQEVVAGAPMQGCTHSMVVSNQGFTTAARKLAALHHCELVGGAELALLGARIRRIVAPAAME
jgi:restriction system protein